MPDLYFAIGTTLANMVNAETYLETPPHILEDGPAPLIGAVANRVRSGLLNRDGFIFHNWRLDYESRDDFNDYIQSDVGGLSVAGLEVYITTIDETGHYSPFLCALDRPYPQENYHIAVGRWIRDLVVPFAHLRLQSATKTGNYTMTASDRLIYGDTTAATRTMT